MAVYRRRCFAASTLSKQFNLCRAPSTLISRETTQRNRAREMMGDDREKPMRSVAVDDVDGDDA